MNTEAIKTQADKLAKARETLAKAKNDLQTIRTHQGQVGYSVHVNGVSISVSAMDNRTYMAKMLRGREMIHLGALKAMQGIVDAWSDQVSEEEATLRSLMQESTP